MRYSHGMNRRPFFRWALSFRAMSVLIALGALSGTLGVAGAQSAGRVILHVETESDGDYCGEVVEWQVGKHLTLKLDSSQTRVFKWPDLVMPGLEVVTDCRTEKTAMPLPSAAPSATALPSSALPIPALVFGAPESVGLYRQESPATDPKAQRQRLCTTPCQLDLDPRVGYFVGGAGLRSSKTFYLPENAANAWVQVQGYGLGWPKAGKLLLGIGIPVLCGGIALITSLRISGGNDAGLSLFAGPIVIGGGFAMTVAGSVLLAVKPRLNSQVFALPSASVTP